MKDFWLVFVLCVLFSVIAFIVGIYAGSAHAWKQCYELIDHPRQK